MYLLWLMKSQDEREGKQGRLQMSPRIRQVTSLSETISTWGSGGREVYNDPPVVAENPKNRWTSWMDLQRGHSLLEGVKTRTL